jgi:hypothetical protein
MLYITREITEFLDFVHRPEFKYQKTRHVGNYICFLRIETDPVSETLCFILFIIPDDEQSPETQQLWPSTDTPTSGNIN